MSEKGENRGRQLILGVRTAMVSLVFFLLGNFGTFVSAKTHHLVVSVS